MTSDDVPQSDLAKSGDREPLQAASPSVLLSTLSSLGIILFLLCVIRWVLPPLLENSRYSWYRGQLRAEHELAGEELRHVSLDGLSRISQLVSQRVTPSVVHINVKQSLDLQAINNNPSAMRSDLESIPMNGQGSGVIVDELGHIVTNYHVLEGGEGIEVRLSDDSRHQASLVGIDQARDVAVLRIEGTELPPITWGDSDQVSVGSPVWAVGSPFGLHGSITFGILSSKHRVDLSDSHYEASRVVVARYSDLMQSDVAINPGNSGGPLVNGRGELIGINTAILGETYQGVSFSIPSKIVKEIFDAILEKSKTAGGWLGVRLEPALVVDPSDPVPETARGARVVELYTPLGVSPARLAGVQPGDLIVGFDDQVIDDQSQLIQLIAATPSGTTITLKIVRQGKPQTIAVSLGKRPVELKVESPSP